MPVKRGFAPVAFDELAWQEDLRRATGSAKRIGEETRSRLEREGQAVDALFACDEDARDGTSLPGCVKVYSWRDGLSPRPPPLKRLKRSVTVIDEMTDADIQHYLIVYDIPSTEIFVRDFGTDYDAALAAYAEAEGTMLGRDDLDIVLVGADSLESVKRTHSSYFGTGETFESLLPAGVLVP